MQAAAPRCVGHEWWKGVVAFFRRRQRRGSPPFPDAQSLAALGFFEAPGGPDGGGEAWQPAPSGCDCGVGVGPNNLAGGAPIPACCGWRAEPHAAAAAFYGDLAAGRPASPRGSGAGGGKDGDPPGAACGYNSGSTDGGDSSRPGDDAPRRHARGGKRARRRQAAQGRWEAARLGAEGGWRDAWPGAAAVMWDCAGGRQWSEAEQAAVAAVDSGA